MVEKIRAIRCGCAHTTTMYFIWEEEDENQ